MISQTKQITISELMKFLQLYECNLLSDGSLIVLVDEEGNPKERGSVHGYSYCDVLDVMANM